MSVMTKIVVTGASGRMGQMLIDTINQSDRAVLCGALERHCPIEPKQAGFRRAVRRIFRDCSPRCRGANAHDTAPLTLDHARHAGLDHPKTAVQIGIDHIKPLLFIMRADGLLGPDTGGIHKDIDGAELALHF